MFRYRSLLTIFLGVFLVWLLPQAASADCGSVVIDPGHGGWDSGAVGPTGFTEKVANLDIGRRVTNLLRRKGYQVAMTRDADVSPNNPPADLTGDGKINISDDLEARVNIANKAKAKVFVSIHNNAAVASARGTETYYWSGLNPNDKSKKLADFIQQAVTAEIGFFNRGVKGANFYVLRRTDMPAALVEGAFISNPTEELLLKTPSFRQKIATGIYKGIRRYVGPPEGRGPTELRVKLKPNTRKTINLNDYFCGKAVGERVTANVPVVAERSMYFDSGNIKGSSTAFGARKASRVWYFAEGFTGSGFNTWILLVNPRPKRVIATMTFMSNGVVKRKRIKLPAKSRRSVNVNGILPNKSFSTRIIARRPIVAERSIYFKSGSRSGGHSSIGVRKPSPKWYFANGYTSNRFDTWILLLNPNKRSAHVQLTYLTAAGDVNSTPIVIPAKSRHSVFVKDQAPDPDASIMVTADAGIVAERAVYFNENGTTGVHDTIGATRPQKKWFFSEGGTKTGFIQSLTLQNPNSAPAVVKIDYILANQTRIISRQKTIPPRSRQTLEVRAPGEAGKNKFLGVRLSSDRGIVAERSIYSNAGFYRGGTASIGAQSPRRLWQFAEGFTGTGFDSSLLILNPNNKVANVKVRFFKE